MVKAGIQKSVDDYIETGKFPQAPSHPTNTCDPYTGNWAEHLMDINHLADILSKTGFNVALLSGYYSRSSKNVIKRFLGSFLNVLIRLLKKQGIRISPFFTIYGTKS